MAERRCDVLPNVNHLLRDGSKGTSLKESSSQGLSKCAILFEEITLLLDTATIEVRDLTTFDAPAVLSKTGVVSVRNASWKYVAYRSLYSRTTHSNDRDLQPSRDKLASSTEVQRAIVSTLVVMTT